MTNEWQDLTRLTQGESFTIERVRLKDKDIVIEGSFELPPLARLTMEDQIFLTAFIRGHGSIKDMEGLFGISYPTVKNRLNSITAQLPFIDLNPPASKNEILRRLECGEISVDDAIQQMKG